MKKHTVIFFILIIIFLEIVIDPLKANVSKADSIRYEYSGDIKYSGYTERINAIKQNHPNWKFAIMQTGLDWNQVIKEEYSGHFTSPKNLIQGKIKGWICSICGEKTYDTGTWMCASEATIKYYMDPRNWIIDSPYLFQFMQTDYIETADNSIYSALNGTFLYSMENAQIINRVCKEKNANPYFIIARIIQEQGTGGGSTYKMVDSDGSIYYNIFNIGASGNGDEVYINALNKAKQMGWMSIEKCLNGGISFLLSDYIEYKQNTLYLNKFDVETYRGTYVKQYMQNIEAPKTESLSMYNKMKTANLLDSNLTFIIPVYENMPEIASYSPDTLGELFPKNIRVKEGHSGVMIRAGRSTSSSIIGRIDDSNVIVLSTERYEDGWHKIVLINGTVGYVKFNSDYLEEIDDITNCYENKTVNNEETTLRVGPGISQTEITKLSKGQVVTRIDNSGMYNIEGKIWDRIILLDGRQGFVSRGNIQDVNFEETFIVNAEGGLYMRETPTGNVIRVLSNGSLVTRLEIGNELGGYNWDKIVAQDGTIGYVAREFLRDTNGNIPNTGKSEENVENVTEENDITENNVIYNEILNDNDENMINNNINETINSNTINETTNQNEIKDDTTNQEREFLVISPEKMSKDLDGIVTKDGIQKEEAGTGYILTKDGKNITIVKRGDANGDGYVKANDYLIIKDYIMGTGKVKLENEYLQAGDVTNDKAVKANDYLKIKDHIMYGVSV